MYYNDKVESRDLTDAEVYASTELNLTVKIRFHLFCDASYSRAKDMNGGLMVSLATLPFFSPYGYSLILSIHTDVMPSVAPG